MDTLIPQRSGTDPAATEAKSERKHHTRRLRATSFRNKAQHDENHHRHRRHAKDVVQSAVETRPPITFDSLLRRDRRSPSPAKRQASNEQQQPNMPAQEQVVAEPVTARDVEKARKENKEREEELRRSLKNVEDVAMSSTRELDETYYSILEKASMLRSTVQSLQQLAEESKKMQSTFEEDTQKLEKETNDNLASFNNFEQQEQTINKLVSRLQDSRTKTDHLNERLESARHRVEAFEQRENEKEANRRMRWHFIWGTLAVIVVLVASILVARNRRAVGLQMNDVGQRLAKMGDAVEEVASPLKSKLSPSPSEDPYLHKLFDEL